MSKYRTVIKNMVQLYHSDRRKTMKFNILKYSILSLILLQFTYCKPQHTSDDKAGQSSAKTSNLKVAMILPDDPAKEPWSANGYNGLLALQKEFGVQIEYSVKTKSNEALEQFRTYARDGFGLIFGHGTEFIKPIEKVAAEFPRTKFALTVHHSGNNRNLGVISFRESELGFLAGAAAALKSKTGKVSLIAGPKVPQTQAITLAFRKGARHVNKNVHVATRFLDSWHDTENADIILGELLRSQFDVIAFVAGTADTLVIKYAEQAGIHTIGWDIDLYKISPATALTSCHRNFSLILREAFLLVQDGRWEGKLYQFGLRERVQELAPFHGKLTPAQVEIMEQIQNDIINGQIDSFS